MKVLYSSGTRPPPCRAVAIGNFDGVHLGHQHLLRQARELAGAGRLGVITFAPLPLEYLRTDIAPGRIGSDAMRVAWLQQAGVDVIWMLTFDQHLAQLSAAQFVRRYLVEGLQIEHVVVGEDFHYGHHRQGNVASLRADGAALGFEVSVMTAVREHSRDGFERISSSRVRQALRRGDLGRVEALLGRAYCITGEIVSGQRLGRELGFPTINIDVGDWHCLLRGIYAVRVRLCDNERQSSLWSGVASIGHRPVVSDHLPNRARSGLWLEAHLFDFAGDCYGLQAEVTLVEKLRDEREFASIEAMQAQMRIDCEQARAVLDGKATGDRPAGQALL